MKLNGWQRLGIILSLLWIPSAYVHTVDTVYSTDSNLAVTVLMGCEDNVARGIGSQDACDKNNSRSIEEYFREAREEAALAALVPVPCAWILAYLIIYLVGWVRRGFKQPTPVTVSAPALVAVPQFSQVPQEHTKKGKVAMATTTAPTVLTKDEMKTSTKTILLCMAILFGGILFAAWAVTEILKFPPEFTESLTEAFLKAGVAVAVLGLAFFRRWINVKNTAIVTAVLSVGLSVWVISSDGSTRRWDSTAGTRNAVQAQVDQPYETPLFSVQFPAGAHVEQQEIRGNHFYSGDMRRGWANVAITDFPEARDRMSMINAMPEAFSTGTDGIVFKPGFWSSPITDTTLGGLPAKERMLRGITVDGGVHLTVRVRTAFSPDGMRAWTLITSFDDERNPLSEAECEKFFDSLKIK